MRRNRKRTSIIGLLCRQYKMGFSPIKYRLTQNSGLSDYLAQKMTTDTTEKKEQGARILKQRSMARWETNDSRVSDRRGSSEEEDQERHPSGTSSSSGASCIIFGHPYGSYFGASGRCCSLQAFVHA